MNHFQARGRIMKKIIFYLLFVFLIFFSGMAVANPWTIDPDHSEVRFKIQHIFSFISGRFSDFNGDLVFDPKEPGQAKFNFTVKTKSVNTFNNNRDNHLRSKDFFDAGKYPVMSFVSGKVRLIAGNRYSLEGRMTIKEVTKPLTIEFSYDQPKLHPFVKGSEVAGFSTSFVIDRLDYQVGTGKFFDLGVVGDKVMIEIAMEALRKK